MCQNFQKEVLLFLNEFKTNLKQIKNRKTFKTQIPNLITLTRLLLIPVILIFLFNGKLYIAGILTIIAILTDFFDGFLARKLKVVNSFGQKFDSISDKIFTICILTALSLTYYYLILVIFLDIAIAFTNSYFISLGRKVTTHYIGKIKTLFLGVLIISIFFEQNNYIKQIIPLLLIITIFLQIITLITYLRKHLKKDI